MPENTAPLFRDLSVRIRHLGDRQESLKSDTNNSPLVGLNAGHRKRSFKKRVHLVRNQYICQQCWKVWPEEGVKDEEKKVFYKTKETGDKFLHRRCGGHVCRWYELNGEPFMAFCRRLFTLPEHRNFFPSMSNLVRQNQAEPDTSHHNPHCTGTCCLMDNNGSLGPEPSPEAEVRVAVSWETLRGFEEQGAKTCAAASVAGALNTVFWAKQEHEHKTRGRKTGSLRRVGEQEVLDYYCQWARESGRTACHAALRGSCGLAASTRKIGNPRLLRAASALALQLRQPASDRAPAAAQRAAPPASQRVLCPQLPCAEGEGEEAGGASEEEAEEWEGGGEGPAVEVVRLMGSEACRESIEEGGRCGAGDGAGVAERQWQRLWAELAGGRALLLHFRNHYALVFALREWWCAGAGAWRRQALTASTRQRPHVWLCFRQLRADISFSKTNQLMLLRPPRRPGASPLAAGACAEAEEGGGRAAAREEEEPPAASPRLPPLPSASAACPQP